MIPSMTRTSRLLFALFVFTGCALSGTLIEPTGVDWNLGESLWLNISGTPQDLYFAGPIFITLTQDGQQFDRDTMCADLFTDIYIGVTYDTAVVDPADAPVFSLRSGTSRQTGGMGSSPGAFRLRLFRAR
jgi:hypothetical protein